MTKSFADGVSTGAFNLKACAGRWTRPEHRQGFQRGVRSTARRQAPPGPATTESFACALRPRRARSETARSPGTWAWNARIWSAGAMPTKTWRPWQVRLPHSPAALA